MIRVIFIDWYNTLSNSVFWGQLSAHALDLHFRLTTALFDQHADLLVPWMRGGLTTEQVLEPVAAATGLELGWVLREFVLGCQCMRLHSPAVPGLVARLRRAGVRVLIATDNMDAFTRWTAPSLNLSAHFDGILNSCELGALKDDLTLDGRSPFFGPYLAQHQLALEECLLIDDSPDTAPVARRLGLGYRQVTGPAHCVDELVEVTRSIEGGGTVVGKEL